ncbi:MAG: hypothetical protein ACOX52_14255 [Verrucomicrobiota bacterium]
MMSETYGAMGDIAWETIYGVAMEQYTKGVNLLIPHAVWYDPDAVTFKPELSWRHEGYAGGLRGFQQVHEPIEPTATEFRTACGGHRGALSDRDVAGGGISWTVRSVLTKGGWRFPRRTMWSWASC